MREVPRPSQGGGHLNERRRHVRVALVAQLLRDLQVQPRLVQLLTQPPAHEPAQRLERLEQFVECFGLRAIESLAYGAFWRMFCAV